MNNFRVNLAYLYYTRNILNEITVKFINSTIKHICSYQFIVAIVIINSLINTHACACNFN